MRKGIFDMVKSQTGDLFYEELKSDEKILIRWYKGDLVSVYIEIALIKLLGWEIITEKKYRKYQSEVVKKAAMLKKIVGYKIGNIMDKDKLKDYLFEILNENDELFSDVSLDDETDTFFITTVDGKRFIVTVSPMTEDESLTVLWEKKNSQLMTIAFGVIYMRDLEVFTEEETNKYLSEIVKKAK
jgi:hypothetical protein